METISTCTDIWHKDFNLKKKDNLNSLPEEKAIFAVFANIGDSPGNCRYIAETENLRVAVKQMFENSAHPGVRKFMQGPWFKILQYEVMPASTRDDRENAVVEWTNHYKPAIDDDGEHPEYYEF